MTVHICLCDRLTSVTAVGLFAVQVMSLKCVCLQEFDSPEELKTKVETLAQWIKESQYMVVHSGAGISTSTGIPDFRYCRQSFHRSVYISIITILL